MKIKFRTVSASALGVFFAGDIAELDDKFAKPIVDGGYAECVDMAPVEKAEEKPAPKRKGKKVE